MKTVAGSILGHIAAFILTIILCVSLAPILFRTIGFHIGFYSLFVIFAFLQGGLSRILFVKKIIIDQEAKLFHIEYCPIRWLSGRMAPIAFDEIASIRLRYHSYLEMKQVNGKRMILKEGRAKNLRSFAEEIAGLLDKHEAFLDTWK